MKDLPIFLLHLLTTIARLLEPDRTKTNPYTPISHPFFERLIGTIHREQLDHIQFWNAQNLVQKLVEFRRYYNRDRVHQSSEDTPAAINGEPQPLRSKISNYSWISHCNGLLQTPIAA